MNRFILCLVLFVITNELYSQREFYGNIFNVKETSYDLKKNELKNKKFESIQISGIIQSSCPMKGCWMEIETSDKKIFVKFKDYSFFVPTKGIKGKKSYN